MISPATRQKLAALYETQHGYRPAPEIAQQLVSKSIVMFVGATCEGKNTIMDAVCELDHQFSISGRFTSREPRESDKPGEYTYYQNTDEGLSELLASIDRRNVVQYAVNPHANLIYGTSLSDYAGDYNLSDVFASSVETFRQLSFKRAIAITIITNPDTWLPRFDARFPIGHPQRKARRDEAIESFTWSLAQDSPDHYWVHNVSNQASLAAQTVIDICLRDGRGEPIARNLATASLKAARGIKL
jgi:guanylate kinase